jgi:L-iditol 2-dehydrogenase
MKALNLHAIGDLRFEELPMPEVLEDEVLVKVEYCGICGSDIPRVFTKGTYHFPTVPGHEFAGVVVEDAQGVLTGKKVAVFPLLPCFECESCKNQSYASCSNYDYYGSRRDGAMAEYISVKRWNLIPLPENVPTYLGAMCEPTAVARHAVLKLGDIKGGDVLISGAGPIGLIAAQWCRHFGANKVYFFDIDERKIRFAEKMGFYEYNDGIKVSFSIEGTGHGAAFARCLHALAPAGRITLMGNPSGDVSLTQNDYWAILRKELVLTGTWNSAYSEMQNDWVAAIDAISKGIIDLEPLISHKISMEEYERAFDIMKNRTEFYNKVMLEVTK